jgi:hypothetical protein
MRDWRSNGFGQVATAGLEEGNIGDYASAIA